MPRIFLLIIALLLTTQVSAAYLGLRVQDLPKHVRAHLPNNVAKTQGVIVDWLDDISPAADDGIKLYDVLLSYNNESIQMPALFLQKIHQANAGQKASIKLVRQGKVLTLKVGLTELPKGEKMTAAPKLASLYRPNSSAKRPPQKLNYQTFPPNARPLNIAGKPAYPMRKKPEVHSWGKERNIWPDFYTDGTNELWDNMMNGPFKMGRMPGGWRAPSMSMPDPVTIGDAVTNQMPPMAEEAVNMMDISD